MAKLMFCEECDWVRSFRHNIVANNRMPEKSLASTAAHWIQQYLSIAGLRYRQQQFLLFWMSRLEVTGIHHVQSSVTHSENHKQPTQSVWKPVGCDWPFLKMGNRGIPVAETAMVEKNRLLPSSRKEVRGLVQQQSGERRRGGGRPCVHSMP